ncbi:MAG: tetratricopeptide repeat protein [Acidimicrobiales bacterium]|nr:tetratricopeptide repeat protein [Acidimicrobiales bacterium]
MVKVAKRRTHGGRQAGPTATRLARRDARLPLSVLLITLVLVVMAGAVAWFTSRLLMRVEAPGRLAEPALLTMVPDLPETVGALPDFERAVAEGDRLLRQAVRSGASPDTVGEMAGRLGNLYQANAHGELAEACYGLATDLTTDNPRWPYLLAYKLQERGEAETVTPLLERTVELEPNYSPAWLKLAENRFKQGKFDEARASYERRLALTAGDPWALLGLARLAIEVGEWSQAESHLLVAIEAAPQFAALHRLLATVHEHYGHTAAGDASRQRANELGRFYAAPDPWVDGLIAQSFDVDWLLLNVSRYALLDPDLSRLLFDRARSLAPEDPDVYVVLHEHVETLEEARRALETAISLDNSHPLAHMRLGELLYRQGEYNQAVELLNRSIHLGADTADAHRYLGLALTALGRLEDAVVALEQAVARAPGDADIHYSFAYVLQRAGRQSDSTRELRRVLELNPGHELAERALAVGNASNER